MLAGCATLSEREVQTTIGPFGAFDGRLIVIEPTRRWQVLVHWQGDRQQGNARLTHAASGRIAEIRWQGPRIELRDNANPLWRDVRFARLAEHGIVLPPQQIATILTGHMPAGLVPKGDNRWEGKLNNSYIRLQWQGEAQRLELTDITHGRRAILIINRP
jgi:hypothetical protein